MQPIPNHLDNIVRPAVRDYVAAESALDAAHIAKDANAIDAARKNVMRRARIAATELHHLQDFVLHNPQPGLSFARIEDIRSALRAACVFGRGTVAVDDTDLLRDTADAFKHHLMTRQNSRFREPQRSSRSATVTARCVTANKNGAALSR